MSIVYHPHHLLPPLPPPSSTPHLLPYPTALTFDPFSDLLWSGSSEGSISSFASPRAFTRNVTFPAHGRTLGFGGEQGVKGLLVGEREVVSLTARGLGGRKRGGQAKWAVRYVVSFALPLLPFLLSSLLVCESFPSARADRQTTLFERFHVARELRRLTQCV